MSYFSIAIPKIEPSSRTGGGVDKQMACAHCLAFHTHLRAQTLGMKLACLKYDETRHHLNAIINQRSFAVLT